MAFVIVAVRADKDDPESGFVMSQPYATKDEADRAIRGRLAEVGYTEIKHDKKQGVWTATDPDNGKPVRVWTKAVE